jgi:predicted ATPase with chaperone activity
MPLGEPSKDIAVRVQRAVDAQARRYQGSGITRNGELSAGTLDQFCDETTGARAVLGQVAREAHMSSRGVSKLRGLARTVADLRQSGAVEYPDVYKAAELIRWEPTV